MLGTHTGLPGQDSLARLVLVGFPEIQGKETCWKEYLHMEHPLWTTPVRPDLQHSEGALGTGAAPGGRSRAGGLDPGG